MRSALGLGLVDQRTRFTPEALPAGAALAWFRADRGVTRNISDLVAQADDLSGSGKHLVQATDANKLTWTANQVAGQPALVGGTGRFMSTVSALTVGAFVIFSVWRASAGGILYEQSPNSNPGVNSGFYLNAPGLCEVNVSRGATATCRAHATLADNAWRVVAHAYDGTNAGHTLRLNGVNETLTDVLTGNPGTSTVTDTLYVMSRAGGGTSTTGALAELLVCGPLSTTLRDAVEEYLRARYAL
jgi:hypothetical protein